MINSAELTSINSNHCASQASCLLSKLKTYRFAIAVILGIVGLSIGTMGLLGYFHVGAFSAVNLDYAISMMIVGFGGGIILGINGIGPVKNRQVAQKCNDALISSDALPGQSVSNQVHDLQKDRDITRNYTVFGPEAWQILDIEVLDRVSKCEDIWKSLDQSIQQQITSGSKILIYIPKEISIKGGHKKEFTSQDMVDLGFMSRDSLSRFKKELEGDLSSGWVVIDINLIPGSEGKTYEKHKEMVADLGYDMPNIKEVLSARRICYLYAQRRSDLPESDVSCFTSCAQMDKDNYPACAGMFPIPINIITEPRLFRWFNPTRGGLGIGVVGVKRISDPMTSHS